MCTDLMSTGEMITATNNMTAAIGSNTQQFVWETMTIQLLLLNGSERMEIENVGILEKAATLNGQAGRHCCYSIDVFGCNFVNFIPSIENGVGAEWARRRKCNSRHGHAMRCEFQCWEWRTSMPAIECIIWTVHEEKKFSAILQCSKWMIVTFLLLSVLF